MRSAFALRIFSGKDIYNFAFGATAFAERSAAMKAPVGLLSGRAVCVSRWRGFAPTSSAERDKRIFTGGVVEENGICSAAFCESAALGGIPPQSLLRKASSPKGAPYGNAGNFVAAAKSRPLGEGGLTRSGKTEGVSSLPEGAGKTVRF